MKKRVVAGMSLKGGRRDGLYISLVEHFENENRTFLKSLLSVSDGENRNGNTVIAEWARDYELEELVVNFPLSKPRCSDCQEECPGEGPCIDPCIREVRSEISYLLKMDADHSKENPKKYEQERNSRDEFDYSRESLDRDTSAHMLSRSFKRRLKRGIVPYWNRPLDFYIWSRYYDQLLEYFSSSYDSYGNTSLKLISRVDYLKKHLPAGLQMFESDVQLTLVELLKARAISKKYLKGLSSLESGASSRFMLVSELEEFFNIFIYEKDMEILANSIRAFESFILSLSGHAKSVELPSWTGDSMKSFLLPAFPQKSETSPAP